ncbi:MAG: glycosyltransferase [Alphaproteobacteria bacterium]
MNIVMLTNTYSPHVGGVARSVEAFTNEYRRRGHRVLVVAPVFPNTPHHETGVVRIPAVQNFNGSDFSVVLPVPGLLTEALDRFRPTVVHSHHPFLLGMTALRVARYMGLPLVFTHHTLYEHYTHYIPGDSPNFKRFVIELATCYANLCDQVFAPSESIEQLLRQRGVAVPITVVPTGVALERFAAGDGTGFRASLGIPRDAFVVGHLGRLAPEKNLRFLAEAVVDFLKADSRAHFLVVGEGPSAAEIHATFERAGEGHRLHLAGVLRNDLADAYHAMNVFAFASKSETQGMVLTEAMAAGVPVVALDASGVREVVENGANGRLLAGQSRPAFVSALQDIANMTPAQFSKLKGGALAAAENFSTERSVARALACYRQLRTTTSALRDEQDSEWERVLHLLQAEWDIVKSMASAAGAALVSEGPVGGREA